MIALALFALLPGVASAAGWLPPTLVNASSDVTPSVGMDGSGNTVVAWENSGASPMSIQGAHRIVGTSGFPALADFSTAPTFGSSDPVVVMNRAGNGLVAWVNTASSMGAQEIKIASVKSDGTVTNVETIDTSGGSDANLTAAINENGDAVVGWLHGGSLEETTRHGLAGSFSTENALTGTADGPPSAAIDGAGNAIVVWPTASASDNVIDGARHAATDGNVTWTAESTSIHTAGHTYTVPQVASNPSGQMVVAFADQGGSNFTIDAIGGTVASDWGTVSTVPTLSGTFASAPHGPSAVMLDKGGAAVGWSTNTAVQMSLRPPPPASFPPAAQVKSVPASAPNSFTLGTDGQGEIIAAWYEFNAASATNVVRASVKPQASPTFGASQIISNSAVFSGPPVLALDQTGDAVAAFPLGPANNEGVAAAFYDDTPPAVGALSGPSTGTTGTPVTFSIPQPSDNFAASPSIAWNLGDGSAAASGTQVTHTFTAPGAYTVSVTVTDNAGNATSQTKVLTVTKASTPPPPPPPPLHCVVPKLKGKTLSQATTALHRAHCALGKVTKPRKPKHRKLRRLIVKSTVPTAGTSHRAGTKVALTLVEVPKPKPKHKKHK